MRYGANRLDFIFTGSRSSGLGETVEQRDQIVSLCRVARSQAGSGQWSLAQATYQQARALWQGVGSPSSLAGDIETTRLAVFNEIPALEVAQRDELWRAGQNNATPEGQTWLGSILTNRTVGNLVSSTAGVLTKAGAISPQAQSGQDVKGIKDAPDVPTPTSFLSSTIPWGKIALGAAALVAVNAFFGNLGRRRR